MNRLNTLNASIFWRRLGIMLAVWCAAWGVIWTVVMVGLNVWLLPNLSNYREALATYLSAQIGHELSIGELSGERDGFSVQFQLKNVQLSAQNHEPLSLSALRLRPAWSSFWRGQLEFSHVYIEAPSLDILRNEAGQFFVNGVLLEASESEENSPLGAWILSQHHVHIDRAALRFRDEKVGVPTVEISGGQILLSRHWLGEHRLNLSGKVSREWADTVQFSMRWRGDDPFYWREWVGELALELGGVRVHHWAAYAKEMLTASEGELGLKVRLEFERAQLNRLNISGSLRDIWLNVHGHAAPVGLPLLAGNVELTRDELDVYRLRAHDLALHTSSAALFESGNIDATWKLGTDGFGRVSVSEMDLAALPAMVHQLPISTDIFEQFALSGFVNTLNAAWTGDVARPKTFTVHGEFDRLAWRDLGGVSVSGLRGKVSLSESGGHLRLNNEGNSRVEIPSMFAHPLDWEAVALDVSVQRVPSAWRVSFSQLALKNALLDAQVLGAVTYFEDAPLQVDLKGTVAHVSADQLEHYLPLGIDSGARDWLKQAFSQGQLRDLAWEISGDPQRFPFKDGGGLWKLTGDLADLSFSFAQHWPILSEIDGKFSFDNQSVELNIDHAKTGDVHLKSMAVTLSDISATSLRVQVNGESEGETAAIFGYLAASPLNELLGKLPEQLTAHGRGRLQLALDIPIDSPTLLSVKGHYFFDRNRLNFQKMTAGASKLPELSEVRGHLRFTERGISSDDLVFVTLGGEARLSARTLPNGEMDFDVSGRANWQELSTHLSRELRGLLQHRAQGWLDYRAQLVLDNGIKMARFSSNLRDFALNLPEPFHISAHSEWPIWVHYEASHSRVRAQLGQIARAVVKLTERGELHSARLQLFPNHQVLSELRPPKRGVMVEAMGGRVSVDDWLRVLGEWRTMASNLNAQTSSNMPRTSVNVAQKSLKSHVLNLGEAFSAFFPLNIELRAQEILAFGASLGASRLTLQANTPQALTGNWESPHFSGHLHLKTEDAWSLNVRADRLNLPFFEGNLSLEEARKWLDLSQTSSNSSQISSFHEFPTIHFEVKQLRLREQDLGRLSVSLLPLGSDLVLKEARWRLPHATLSASGKVFAQTGKISLNYQIDSNDIGKTLDAFFEQKNNYVREGSGSICGHFAWKQGAFWEGAGAATIEVHNGRLPSVDVGVGKLLAALSVRSIPRRLRADFSDLFADGVTFDTIAAKISHHAGQTTLAHAIFKSTLTDLVATGTAIPERGHVDVRVKVLPHISEPVAFLGAYFLNPWAGLAMLGVQKALQDPLAKLLFLNYRVHGAWSEPTIESF